jgi:hypothetical protein
MCTLVLDDAYTAELMAIADQRAPLSPLAAAPVLPPVAQPLERAAAGTSFPESST